MQRGCCMSIILVYDYCAAHQIVILVCLFFLRVHRLLIHVSLITYNCNSCLQLLYGAVVHTVPSHAFCVTPLDASNNHGHLYVCGIRCLLLCLLFSHSCPCGAFGMGCCLLCHSSEDAWPCHGLRAWLWNSKVLSSVWRVHIIVIWQYELCIQITDFLQITFFTKYSNNMIIIIYIICRTNRKQSIFRIVCIFKQLKLTLFIFRLLKFSSNRLLFSYYVLSHKTLNKQRSERTANFVLISKQP